MLASLHEIGIDRSDQTPTKITDDLLRGADVIISLKPDLDITYPATAVHETWSLPDPADWDVESIRPLREHLDQRTKDLIDRITAQ